MAKKKVNLYGWTEEHTEAIGKVYKQLAAQHVPGIERDGKPNVSSIMLYLLEKAANKKRP
jgi:hypothetical protein